jgi:hypothetical protein
VLGLLGDRGGVLMRPDSGGGGGFDVLAFTDEVAAGVRDGARQVRDRCHRVETRVPTGARAVRDAAGQFGGDMLAGVTRFELSWAAAVKVCGHEADVIAANVGSYALDVRAVDAACSANGVEVWL